MSDASIAIHPVKEDPFHEVQVLTIIGRSYAHRDMILAMSEMTVLEDWLKI